MFAFNVQTLGLMAWPHWFFATLLSRPALIIQEPLEYRTRDGNVLTPNNLFIATSIRVVLWPYLASPKSINEWSDAKNLQKHQTAQILLNWESELTSQLARLVMNREMPRKCSRSSLTCLIIQIIISINQSHKFPSNCINIPQTDLFMGQSTQHMSESHSSIL